MGKPITSLPEAKAVIAQMREEIDALTKRVDESVGAIGEFLDGLSGLLGGGTTTKAKRVPRPAPVPPARSSLLGEAAVAASKVVTTAPERGGPRAPATMIERVLVIIRDLQKDLGRPVMPKDIEREYLLRSWPSPKNGTLYNLVSGTVGYLFNQKKLLNKTEQGYSLIHNDVHVLLASRPRKRKRTKAEMKLASEIDPNQTELTAFAS